MKIAADLAVTIDYTLTDETGEVIDQSGDTPLDYLHGHGQLVPGLEAALLGHEPGATLQVSVAPEEGYGVHHGERVVEVKRSELPADLALEVGAELATEGEDGEEMTLWVAEVGEDTVILDGNHPLAGITLNFAVTVRQVRQATAEELSHRHVHGPGAHP